MVNKNNSKQDINVANAKKATLTAEKLNAVTIKRMLGHTNVVYYNCETNAWNTNKYNGCTITDQKADTNRVKKFKTVMDMEPEFSQQYEFAVFAIMTIAKVSYPGSAKPISKPRYSREGKAVVGNIIVKNKATGKYELYCPWIGVHVYCDSIDAVINGAYGFAGDGIWDSAFRAALIASHAR